MTLWRRHGVAGAGAALVVGLLLGTAGRCAPGSNEAAVASVGRERSPESSAAMSRPRHAEQPSPPLVLPLEAIATTSLALESAAAPFPSAAEKPRQSATLAVTPRAFEAKLGAPATPTVELRARGGSYVLLDGRPLGATPVKISIPAGDHVATFVHEGQTASRAFTVKPGEQLALEVGPDDFEIANPYLWGSGLEQPNASAVPVEAAPFDRAAAGAALRRMAERARTCARPRGPSGIGVVRVRLAPSGRVESASVSGALADSPVGDCVAGLFRTVSIRPFSGPAQILALSVPVQ